MENYAYSAGVDMTQDELKLVFDALKQCNSYAFAGGLGLRATAHRDALAILEKAIAALESQEPVACDCNQGQVCHICDPITRFKENT